eukprot:353287-Prymnesium_polylepis.3
MLRNQETRVTELTKTQSSHAQHANDVLRQAQQFSQAELEHTRAEAAAEIEAVRAQSEWWRARVQRAQQRMGRGASDLEKARAAVESLMTRIVQ